MKELLIYRHSFACLGSESGLDIDRQLSNFGKKVAKHMGDILLRCEVTPEMIMCSPAVRAQQTLEYTLVHWEFDKYLIELNSLYFDNEHQIFNDLIKEINRLSNIDKLMIIGHEPVCSRMVANLVGNFSVDFTEASIARIAFDKEDWSDIHYGDGLLLDLYKGSV
jgi:phosphohistidine phosphatase